MDSHILGTHLGYAKQNTPNGIKVLQKTKRAQGAQEPWSFWMMGLKVFHTENPGPPISWWRKSSGLQALAGGWISYWSDHSNSESPHYISSQVGLIGYSTLSLAVPWILKDIFDGFFCLRWDGMVDAVEGSVDFRKQRANKNNSQHKFSEKNPTKKFSWKVFSQTLVSKAPRQEAGFFAWLEQETFGAECWYLVDDSEILVMEDFENNDHHNRNTGAYSQI